MQEEVWVELHLPMQDGAGRGYNDSLEFKNKQPKEFQCKLFDLINTLNSNSNKRQNRGKWERAHAIALLEEIASYKKV